MMEHQVQRGNVYLVEMPIQDNTIPHSVEQGRRPVVVVSSDVGCRTSGIVMVCPITTKIKSLSCNVDTTWTMSEKKSQILCNQIVTMPKAQMTHYKGYIPRDEMRKVNIAILLSLGIKTNYEEVQ
jgi:mRNA-degrading endonuclease toxin of MazEF toxin-antitoxin module